MATKTLDLHAGDLQPPYQFEVVGASGAPIDLSGSQVYATMNVLGTGTNVVDRVSCVLTEPASGRGEYRWAAGDTDTPGTYEIEFLVDSMAGPYTVPARDKDRALVIIHPAL